MELKSAPMLTCLANNGIQDVFQLFSPKEQRLIISKQQKKFQEEELNINDLEKDDCDDEEELARPEEGTTMKLFDEAEVSNKDPFLHALTFIRKLDEEQLLIRWLNFIYKAYQQQEFNV